LLRPKLNRSDSLLVVPLHPVTNGAPGLVECLEHVLPDTFFLEASKESFDD
jgi:hypothetical protein